MTAGNKSKLLARYSSLKRSLAELKSPTILVGALLLLIASVLVLILAIQRGNYLHANGKNANRRGAYSDHQTHHHHHHHRQQQQRNAKCNFISCFDIYRCGNDAKDLRVYVYPEALEIDPGGNVTREFHRMARYIARSKYYTPSPEAACIFVPSVETLGSSSRQRLLLHNAGRNHLVLNVEMVDARTVLKNSSEDILAYAMIADVGLTRSDFRKEFDVSLPAWSDSLMHFRPSDLYRQRDWFVTAAQLNLDRLLERDLAELALRYPSEVRILRDCGSGSSRCHNRHEYKYPDVLKSSTFCLISRGERSGFSVLLEALAAQCVPVILNDAVVMPFAEVVDWSRAAVFIREASAMNVVELLRRYSPRKLEEFRRQGSWLFDRYFGSMERIAETVLEIITDRIYPHFARDYRVWNEPELVPAARVMPFVSSPSTMSKNNGFTAVVLTYDRVDSLFALLEKLGRIPSLVKILVIWNNEYKTPPRSGKWPRMAKPMKILHTERNLLSNRFYPYEEIETEAVLSIDDDILMLTEDEIEFAYEVWKEFPDRIVGFPSRMHVWDNRTDCWKYESEWTNHISMVLTGAAFYHKYWNYAYTIHLPESVKEWVDYYMNCEDIAMNFLVSNMTDKAPIKVTAKKKFRCPECVSTEMLSADSKHMIQRSECVNKFSNAFGRIPLIPVEFRADPVLYKDSFPDKLKRFNDVGNL